MRYIVLVVRCISIPHSRFFSPKRFFPSSISFPFTRPTIPTFRQFSALHCPSLFAFRDIYICIYFLCVSRGLFSFSRVYIKFRGFADRCVYVHRELTQDFRDRAVGGIFSSGFSFTRNVSYASPGPLNVNIVSRKRENARHAPEER